MDVRYSLWKVFLYDFGCAIRHLYRGLWGLIKIPYGLAWAMYSNFRHEEDSKYWETAERVVPEVLVKTKGANDGR